jgi:uncharacterized protein (DUF302 family)
MVYEEVIVLSVPFEEALARVKSAFQAEGFGTLTEIDLQATLAEKVGMQMGRYVIVGACNPQLAARALAVEPQIGVLLPCNVVVRESEDHVAVEAMDPGLISVLSERAELQPLADEARRLVGDALARLSTPIRGR